MSNIEYLIADIALGVFFGWFLIRFWLKFCDGWKQLTDLLQRYVDTVDMAKKALRSKND
jgi:hypothetical protein